MEGKCWRCLVACMQGRWSVDILLSAPNRLLNGGFSPSHTNATHLSGKKLKNIFLDSRDSTAPRFIPDLKQRPKTGYKLLPSKL